MEHYYTNNLTSKSEEKEIDLADFLVEISKKTSRFLPGPQIIGGPTDIAVITKHEGFKWIQRKHYYDYNLNIIDNEQGE